MTFSGLNMTFPLLSGWISGPIFFSRGILDVHLTPILGLLWNSFSLGNLPTVLIHFQKHNKPAVTVEEVSAWTLPAPFLTARKQGFFQAFLKTSSLKNRWKKSSLECKCHGKPEKLHCRVASNLWSGQALGLWYRLSFASPISSGLDRSDCLEHIPKAEKSGAWPDQRLLSTQQKTNVVYKHFKMTKND